MSGYVEKLYLNKTFTLCKEGEPLAEIYSPDLTARPRSCCWPPTASGHRPAGSARQRLQLLGVSDEEITPIVKSGKASRGC